MGYYVLFYHYTSERGLRGIKSSGKIRNSSHENNHAHFGEGTYGTSLPPSVGKQKVAKNNWKDYGNFYIQNGKVDWAIEVRIPHHKVRKAPRRNRDILVHDGPIYLKDYQWRALKVPDTHDPYDEFDDDDDDDFGFSSGYSRGGQRAASYASARYNRTSNPKATVVKEALSSASYSPRRSNEDYDYDYSRPTKPDVAKPEGDWGGKWIAVALVSFGLYYFLSRNN